MKYHQLMEHIHIRPNRRLYNPHAGCLSTNKSGHSDDFLKNKPYTAGDALKKIDWKRYSRERKLYSRDFGDESDYTILLAIDTTASMTMPTNEKRITQETIVSALAYNALHRGHNLILFDLGSGLSERIINNKQRGMAQVNNWLGKRAYHHEHIQLDAGIIDHYKSLLFIMISDCWSQELLAFIDRQNRLCNDFLCIRLLSEEERSPQLHGSILLKDIETDKFLQLRVTSELLMKYEDLFNKQTKELVDYCQQYNYRFFDWVISHEISPLLIRLGR